MSTEKNKAIMRELVNASNAGDPSRLHDVIREVIADDFVGHAPGAPDFYGPDEYIEHLTAYHAAFPDVQNEIVDMVAEGDRIMQYYVWTGTHEGPFLGIPPTGRRVSVPAVAILRFRDGKLVEETDISDSLYMYQQLGVEMELKVPEA